MRAGAQHETEVAGRKPATKVTVWDPLVRLFHWSLVGAFALAYLTGEDFDWLHQNAGWVVLGLIGFRLLWGIVGTRHARFSDFVPSPRKAWLYGQSLMQGSAKRYLGHNPLGGLMIIILIIAVASTALTGAAMTTEWGFRSKLLEETHEIVANLSLVLVAVHITGVIVMSLAHGENLVRAMITGRKRAAM